MSTERIGAVFSGGGARGAAHIGAHRAFEELGVTPDYFVGTSMGAVMAACLASGLGYEEVLQRVTTVTRRDVASLSPGVVLGPMARSVLKAGPFRETLEALVPARTFEELRRPLTVTAVDRESGDLVLFGEGGRNQVPLIDALYASCALPVYYPPARIGDREYVDGGLRAVLPLDVALQFDPSLILAVSVGPSLYDNVAPGGFASRGIVAAHRQTVRIMMAIQTERLVAKWTKEPPVDFVLVQPRLVRTGTFAVDRLIEYVEEGYRSAFQAVSDRGDG